ncbi:MAG: PilZ domain-containing protein [Thermodesulfobacteriota bacterium]
MQQEKRKEKRYMVRGRALALVSPNNIMPFQILDISRSGLAFSYNGTEDWGNELLELELFDDEDFYLDQIPIKIISDIPVDDTSHALRRCGVQFGELSPNQQALLEYFIQKHTVGIA